MNHLQVVLCCLCVCGVAGCSLEDMTFSDLSGNIKIDGFFGDDDWDDDCQYDSDCPDICVGDVRWKQGCNPRKGICIQTFDYPCADTIDVFGDLSFSHVCRDGSCVSDTQSINRAKQQLEQQRSELSDEVKLMIAGKQEITEVWVPYYFERCHSGLSQVTNKLIIDTALMLSAPPSTLLDVTTGMTQSLAEELLEQVGDSSAMSAEEFIAWNCKYYEALYTDLAVYDTKIDRALEQARIVSDQLAAFP